MPPPQRPAPIKKKKTEVISCQHSAIHPLHFKPPEPSGCWDKDACPSPPCTSSLGPEWIDPHQSRIRNKQGAPSRLERLVTPEQDPPGPICANVYPPETNQFNKHWQRPSHDKVQFPHSSKVQFPCLKVPIIPLLPCYLQRIVDITKGKDDSSWLAIIE